MGLPISKLKERLERKEDGKNYLNSFIIKEKLFDFKFNTFTVTVVPINATKAFPLSLCVRFI